MNLISEGIHWRFSQKPFATTIDSLLIIPSITTLPRQKWNITWAFGRWSTACDGWKTSNIFNGSVIWPDNHIVDYMEQWMIEVTNWMLKSCRIQKFHETENRESRIENRESISSWKFTKKT
jgi:hypothetical protein